ncbi:MAG: hypothetical protein Q9184_003896 [Pyrenodesmia sp. 2 TL-2023]
MARALIPGKTKPPRMSQLESVDRIKKSEKNKELAKNIGERTKCNTKVRKRNTMFKKAISCTDYIKDDRVDREEWSITGLIGEEYKGRRYRSSSRILPVSDPEGRKSVSYDAT